MRLHPPYAKYFFEKKSPFMTCDWAGGTIARKNMTLQNVWKHAKYYSVCILCIFCPPALRINNNT